MLRPCRFGNRSGGTRGWQITLLVLVAALGPIAMPRPAAAQTEVDLVLGKQDTPDPVIAGQTLTYTLTVENLGPATAIGAQIVDPLPAGVTIGALPANCSATGQTVTCTMPDLPPLTPSAVQLLVTVNPGTRGVLSNTATAISNEPELNPADNSATSTTGVTVRADRALTKADAPDPVPAGGQLVYTLGASNLGPSSATNVVVTDTLPAGTTLVTSTPACTGTTTLTCPLGTIAPNAAVPLTITVAVAPSVPAGTTLTNSATISGTEPDPVGANNTATATTTVAASADVGITKSHTIDPVVAGAGITYQMTVTNDGPAGATNVVVTDVLPAGVTVAAPPAGCTATTTGFDCDIGDLPTVIGEVISATGLVSPALPEGATIINTATVTASEADVNPANNTATDTATVTRSADITLTKADDPDPATAGGSLTYSLTLTNVGPSFATGATIIDTLPAGFVVTDAAGCGMVPAGTVTCTIAGDVPIGVPQTFTIQGTVDPSSPAGTVLTNNAIVVSATSDPDATDNSATTTTTVTPSADLGITKSAPTPVASGAEVVFTLRVANAGPSDAAGVTVIDTLSPQLVFGDATNACSESDGTVTCTVPTLASGGEVAIEIRATIDSAFTGSLTNNASVSAATPDPDTSDNTTTLDLVVMPSPPGSISGSVFHDLNTDGRRDLGEPDISGAVVTLTAAGPDGMLGTADDIPVGTVTTASPYRFENLTPGEYRVAVAAGSVPDLIVTDDSDGGRDARVDVLLGSGQSATGVDFGYGDAPAVGSGGVGQVFGSESSLPSTGGHFGAFGAVGAWALLTGAQLLAFRRRPTTRC